MIAVVIAGGGQSFAGAFWLCTAIAVFAAGAGPVFTWIGTLPPLRRKVAALAVALAIAALLSTSTLAVRGLAGAYDPCGNDLDYWLFWPFSWAYCG